MRETDKHTNGNNFFFFGNNLTVVEICTDLSASVGKIDEMFLLSRISYYLSLPKVQNLLMSVRKGDSIAFEKGLEEKQNYYIFNYF